MGGALDKMDLSGNVRATRPLVARLEAEVKCGARSPADGLGREMKILAVEGDRVALVVFLVEGQRYGLPVSAVHRVLPMVAVSRLPQAPPIALGVINLHGDIIPVLDLRRRLGFRPRDYGITAHLVVARTPRRTLAVPVDEVLGVWQVAVGAVTPPDAVLPRVGHVAGIVALADGLLFIHDLDTFLSLDEDEQLTQVLSERNG